MQRNDEDVPGLHLTNADGAPAGPIGHRQVDPHPVLDLHAGEGEAVTVTPYQYRLAEPQADHVLAAQPDIDGQRRQQPVPVVDGGVGYVAERQGAVEQQHGIDARCRGSCPSRGSARCPPTSWVRSLSHTPEALTHYLPAEILQGA